MILKYPDKTIYVGKAEYVFYFLVIIFLGSAMVLTRNSLEAFGGSDVTTVVAKAFMFVFAIHLFNKHGNNFRTSIPWNIVAVLFIWALLQFIKYKFFSSYALMRLMNLFFAVVIIKVYGTKNIYFFEYVVSKLSAISLIGWGLVLLMPDVMLDLASLSPLEEYGLVQNGSFFVFGIADNDLGGIRRNLGFAWEPGRFGSILCIGLFFNLIAYKFKIKGNKHFWYILIAILSSQSTTAYMSMIFVLCVYLYNKRRDVFLKLLPIFIILFLILASLEFMGEKIQSLWLTEEHALEWEKQLDYYSTQDGELVPQRFDGLLYEFMNILHDPLIGNASDQISYLYSIFQIKFSLCNGCLRIFANMGIIMGILYYIMLYKSSVYLKSIFQYKGTWAWLILFILINISYSWIFEPVFLGVILLYMYDKSTFYRSARVRLK